MAVSLYDDALVKKLKSWTEKTQVTILPPNETKRLFEIISDENNDQPLKLPIIALVREGGYTLNQSTKQPGTYDGIRLQADGDNSVNLRKISISIPYRIDIYTIYFKEADEYARELVFNLINYPTVTVTIPYNGVEKEYNAIVNLHQEIEDNSGIPERLISGQFYRMSIRFDIDNGYLYDVRVKNSVQLTGEGLYVYKEEGSSDVIKEKLLDS